MTQAPEEILCGAPWRGCSHFSRPPGTGGRETTRRSPGGRLAGGAMSLPGEQEKTSSEMIAESGEKESGSLMASIIS